MAPSIYPYRFNRLKKRDHRARYLIQYIFTVNCLNSEKILDYALNFYKYGKWIYITDFFPLKWEKDQDCFHKLLSNEENHRVNFRKIAITCFYIFHQRISPLNINAAFVVSGSYVKGEQPLPGTNMSRKLKLYRAIFQPIAQKLEYDIIDILDHNAIVLIKKIADVSPSHIREQYINFKQNKIANI